MNQQRTSSANVIEYEPEPTWAHNLTNYESCVRHSGVVGVYADCRLVCWGTVGVECVDGSTNETVEDLLVLFYLTEEIYRYIYI